LSHIKRHPQFPVNNDILYLNHAAVSPWPLTTANAIHAFTMQNLHSGSANYLKWMETEQSLRELMSKLINASSPDDISLLKNTSEGLSIIAHGLDWLPGDNIVIPANEFPSNRIVWESLIACGVEIRQISSLDSNSIESALIKASDDKTRLISVSAVQYHNGFRMNLPIIGDFCRNNDILFVVDAIQQLGALVFDLEQIKADFVVADGHKWMMAPEGLALFYSHPDARQKLHLHQYGWRMIENPTDFNQKDWEIAADGKRFECGSPNMLGIHALHASLTLIHETGQAAIEESILSNTRYLIDYIDNNNDLTLVSSSDLSRHSGICSFRHEQVNNNQLFDYLTKKGVQCAIRGDAIRLSPHFYQHKQELNQLFKIIDTI